jgi:hypothetical protein
MDEYSFSYLEGTAYKVIEEPLSAVYTQQKKQRFSA